MDTIGLDFLDAGPFSIAVLALSVVGAIMALLQFRRLVNQDRAEKLRRQKEYALSYSLVRWATHVEARRELTNYFGPTTHESQTIPLAKINAACDENPNVRNWLRTVLNHWENMALAVHEGVADEDTAFEMVSVRVINTAKHYRAYIDDILKHNPLSYKHLVWLTDRWEKRLRRQSGGRPVRR